MPSAIELYLDGQVSDRQQTESFPCDPLIALTATGTHEHCVRESCAMLVNDSAGAAKVPNLAG
jgi:hypothetical protein